MSASMSQKPRGEILARAAAFCEMFDLRAPILMAPMASVCPPSLAIAVANAGGLAGCGALAMPPDAIRKWMADVRTGSNGGFQVNLWIPDPPPRRDPAAEDAMRQFLGQWGPPVAREAGDVTLPNFEAQCEALLETGPAAVSSMMGLFPDRFVARMKDKGIKWFATVTTLSEAKTAEQAGADVIIAQGMEAGGHRGAFDVTQDAAPEDTLLTRVFTGRPARGLATDYARAATAPGAPPPAPYPVQRGLTQSMREAAAKQNDIRGIQAWAGQSGGLTTADPAGDIVRRMSEDAQALLG